MQPAAARQLILVAGSGGRGRGHGVGRPAGGSPDHQVLVPRRAAEIHTVVLGGYRDSGVGAALLEAAEEAAAKHGVLILYASIFTSNTGAVRFYSSAGFGPRGTVLSKEQGTPQAR